MSVNSTDFLKYIVHYVDDIMLFVDHHHHHRHHHSAKELVQDSASVVEVVAQVLALVVELLVLE